MGQKISTIPIDKGAQDRARFALYLLMVKLLNIMQEFDDKIPENYN